MQSNWAGLRCSGDRYDGRSCAEQLVAQRCDRFGRIDAVVNNVGDLRWGTLGGVSLEEWQKHFFLELMTRAVYERADCRTLARPVGAHY